MRSNSKALGATGEGVCFERGEGAHLSSADTRIIKSHLGGSHLVSLLPNSSSLLSRGKTLPSLGQELSWVVDEKGGIVA